MPELRQFPVGKALYVSALHFITLFAKNHNMIAGNHATLSFTAIDLLRNQFSHLGPFWWMLWNALLALIPVLLTVVFFKRERQAPASDHRRTFTFFLELAITVLFLPNAPYVATDLIHFAEAVRMSDTSLWKLLGTEFPLYVSFVIFGLACYAFSTDRLLYALEMRFGKSWYWIGLIAIPLLSAIGIYLGRVARFNTWDILQDPTAILSSTRDVVDSTKVLKVVGSMTLLLILVHQAYKIVHDGIRVRMGHYVPKQSLSNISDS
jgi:uncharacterized membrane protein